MRRLYCGDGSGIAVRTTYQKLFDSIRNERLTFIGMIRYLDFKTEGYPFLRNMLDLAMHKRVEFSYETEVRIVKCLGAEWDRAKPAPSHVECPWSCSTVAESIYVHPEADQYYDEAVQAVVHCLAPELDEKVSWSPMKGSPEW